MENEYKFHIKSNNNNIDDIKITLIIDESEYLITLKDFLHLKINKNIKSKKKTSPLLNKLLEDDKIIEENIFDEFSEMNDEKLIKTAYKLIKESKKYDNKLKLNLRGLVCNNKIKTPFQRKSIEDICRICFDLIEKKEVMENKSNEIKQEAELNNNINSELLEEQKREETPKQQIIIESSFQNEEIDKIFEMIKEIDISYKNQIKELIHSKKCLYRFRKGDKKGERCYGKVANNSYFCEVCHKTKPEIIEHIRPLKIRI
jgi:hypothetical protein